MSLVSVVSAEAVAAVAQHARGLVRLPADIVETLEGALAEAGVTGKAAKLCGAALTGRLQAVARLTARDRLQHHTSNSSRAAMTQAQKLEAEGMEAQAEELTERFGPQTLAWRRAVKAQAATMAELPLPMTRSGRVRASARAALEAHLMHGGALSLPHEYVRAALKLPPSTSLGDSERTAALQAAAPTYNARTAAAYGLVRLPACFAVASRVLHELSTRLPGFSPRSLLDFGAGPGTASWAAQEVWPGTLKRITAVEPSQAMRDLGERLEAARRFAHPSAPLVRWRDELPLQNSAGRSSRQVGTHDMVVASYVLGEVHDPQKRATLLRQLWALTGDMLVLLEPGTPTGAAVIADARTQLLAYEARRTAKLRRAGILQGPSTIDGSQNNSIQHDANVARKLSSRQFGAHVVAPCPHDGVCPLAAPGSPAWCHFVVRFSRPKSLQDAKASHGAHTSAQNYQDERFSRGKRPATPERLAVARSFNNAATISALPFVQAGGDESNALRRDLEHPDSASDGTDCDGDMDGMELPSSIQQQKLLHADALDQDNWGLEDGRPLQHSMGAPHPDAAARFTINVTPSDAQPPTAGISSLLTSEEVIQLRSLLGGATSQHPFQLELHQENITNIPNSEQSTVLPSDPPTLQEHSNSNIGHLAPTDARLGAFGSGLVDRLIALEDAGIEWETGAGNTGLTAEMAQYSPHVSTQEHHPPQQQSLKLQQKFPQQQHSIHELQPPSSIEQGAISAALDKKHSDKDENGQSPTDVASAAAASMQWARIIRPPRRRDGHVILDVCAAKDTNDDERSHDEARNCQLERHIVSRSDARRWMGRAAYRLAVDAQWGDQWPDFYAANPKRQVLHD